MIYLVDCGSSWIAAAAIHKPQFTRWNVVQLVDCSSSWITVAAIHNDVPQLEPFFTVPVNGDIKMCVFVKAVTI